MYIDITYQVFLVAVNVTYLTVHKTLSTVKTFNLLFAGIVPFGHQTRYRTRDNTTSEAPKTLQDEIVLIDTKK